MDDVQEKASLRGGQGGRGRSLDVGRLLTILAQGARLGASQARAYGRQRAHTHACAAMEGWGTRPSPSVMTLCRARRNQIHTSAQRTHTVCASLPQIDQMSREKKGREREEQCMHSTEAHRRVLRVSELQLLRYCNLGNGFRELAKSTSRSWRRGGFRLSSRPSRPLACFGGRPPVGPH